MKENIEEDIEIVKAFLEECDRDLVGEICLKCNGLTRNAIEAVLLEYKRVLKENEDWQKTYQEEKEKQFELLRENQQLQKENEELLEIRISAGAHNRIIELEKENEELREENEQLESIKDEAIRRYNFETVPTQKVKDKIEELKEKPLTINENNKYYYETDAYNKIIIQVLQDLLEEKGE